MGTLRTSPAGLAVIASVVVVFIGLSLSRAPHSFASGNCSADPSFELKERALLEQINGYRQANGRLPLVVSESLSRAAQWKVQHVAEQNYFAHDDIPIGRSWGRRISDCGYVASPLVGENLVAGRSTPGDTLDAWIASGPHNQNLLDADYRAIGIGFAYVAPSRYGWYWAADFGGAVERTAPTPTPTRTKSPVPTATPSTPTAIPVRFVPTPPPSRRSSPQFHAVLIPGAVRN